jgi:hypothetical protein
MSTCGSGLSLVVRAASPRESRSCGCSSSAGGKFLDRQYAIEQVRGYLGHVVVDDLQDPKAATSCTERVPNRPMLAFRDEGGRRDGLACRQLQQVTALAADAASLSWATIQQDSLIAEASHPKTRKSDPRRLEAVSSVN